MEAHRSGLLPAPVAGVREAPPRSEVLAAWELALGDTDIARDTALAHYGVVAAWCRARVRSVVEQNAVDLWPVIETEIHVVVQRPTPPRQFRDAVAHDFETGGQPAVVHGRQYRGERFARWRPVRELLSGSDVVPVIELPARFVALHRLERAQRSGQTGDGFVVADDTELLSDDRAPHVGTDIGGGGVHAPGAVHAKCVGRQAGVRIGHSNERGPGVLSVTVQRLPGAEVTGSAC
jgi:hypothetical protein